MASKLEQLIKDGIPVNKAEFQSAVNNADNTPENTFSMKSENSSRRVEMWLHGSLLICRQKDAKKNVKIFGTAVANCRYINFE